MGIGKGGPSLLRMGATEIKQKSPASSNQEEKQPLIENRLRDTWMFWCRVNSSIGERVVKRTKSLIIGRISESLKDNMVLR